MVWTNRKHYHYVNEMPYPRQSLLFCKRRICMTECFIQGPLGDIDPFDCVWIATCKEKHLFLIVLSTTSDQGITCLTKKFSITVDTFKKNGIDISIRIYANYLA